MSVDPIKITRLAEIARETEIHELLEELLPRMGFQNVIVTHQKGSRPENGKDLIASMRDTINERDIWFAFVVKKGRVAGASAPVNEIQDQARDCFQYPYVNPVAKKNVKISRVTIVVNEYFSEGAKDKIEANEHLNAANIDFWDSKVLINNIDKYFEEYWLKGSVLYKKYVSAFNSIIDNSNNVFSAFLAERGSSVKTLETLITPRLRSRSQNDEGEYVWKDMSLLALSSSDRNTIIVGDAGSGKSTLVKDLAKTVIRNNHLREVYDYYPFSLTFWDLASSGNDLLRALQVEMEKLDYHAIGIPIPKILKEGHCIIFLDALDELATEARKRSALEAVSNFHKKYPLVRFVCTSRTSDFIFHECESLGFNYVNILNLDIRQIEQYVNSFYTNNVDKSSRLLKSLKDTAILDRMPKTPLTIALITMLHEEEEVEIPATISDLYGMFIDLLLGKYKISDTVDILQIGVKHRVLCEIACELHTSNSQSIEKNVLHKLIQNYAKQRGQEINAEEILEDICQNSSLLIRTDNNEYEFRHLSFQEYFTSYSIFHHRADLKETMTSSFANLWWQNVTIFYAGITKDSPSLIESVVSVVPADTVSENVTYSLGIGLLLQALYNSPLDNRTKGVSRGVETMANAHKIIMSNRDTAELRYFHEFSEYNWSYLMAQIFAWNYRSVTLYKPMIDAFNQAMERVSTSENGIDQAYFLALALSVDEYKEYTILESLLSKASFLSDAQIGVIKEVNKRIRRINSAEKGKGELKKIDKTVFKEFNRRNIDADGLNTKIADVLNS